MTACQAWVGGYLRRLGENDAIFTENIGDELGAGASDVRVAHLRRIHDRKCRPAPPYGAREAHGIWVCGSVFRLDAEELDRDSAVSPILARR